MQICRASDFVFNTSVKVVLRDHCHARPPVLKDKISFLAEGPTFHLSSKTTCLERSYSSMSDEVVFQDRFHNQIRYA